MDYLRNISEFFAYIDTLQSEELELALQRVRSEMNHVTRKFVAPRVEIICPQCGVIFERKRFPKKGFFSYCSLACKQTITEEQKFLSIGWTVTPSGCWEWNGRLQNGYGYFDHRLKAIRCSRLSWERKNGPTPIGMLHCHKCDNPPCINPDHLFLGTHADNVADKFRKGRQAKGGWSWAKPKVPTPVRQTRQKKPLNVKKGRVRKLSDVAIGEILAAPNYRGVLGDLGKKFSVTKQRVHQIRSSVPAVDGPHAGTAK